MKLCDGITANVLKNGTVRITIYGGGPWPSPRFVHLSKQKQRALLAYLNDLLSRKDATDAAGR